MNAKLLIAVTTMFALSGCSVVGGAKYGCPAPDGVTCMSPLEVYSATETADHVTGKKSARATKTTDRHDPSLTHAVADRGLAVDNGSLTLVSLPGSLPADVAPEDVPLRTPARVMRIFIAPWEDENGDLHLAERLYTEISPRRWTVGAPAPEVAKNLELLQPLNSTSVGTPASAQTTARTPNPGRLERPGLKSQDGSSASLH